MCRMKNADFKGFSAARFRLGKWLASCIYDGSAPEGPIEKRGQQNGQENSEALEEVHQGRSGQDSPQARRWLVFSNVPAEVRHTDTGIPVAQGIKGCPARGSPFSLFVGSNRFIHIESHRKLMKIPTFAGEFNTIGARNLAYRPTGGHGMADFKWLSPCVTFRGRWPQSCSKYRLHYVCKQLQSAKNEAEENSKEVEEALKT